MLSNIRNFSKTIFAKILLVIMVIPFVLWGMGSVFNSGNTNNIVKINNHNISTQDFMDYLNNSNLNSELIKNNIDNNVLEELLSGVISKKMIEMEIEDLGILISDNSLIKKIKGNKNFLGEDDMFSRIKYEKFLLSQNLNAIQFEKKLKENELKKKLFAYISGGIKSPDFLVDSVYKKQTSKLELRYVNLDNSYRKEKSFSDDEIKSFVNENINELEIEYIDFTYLKITPKDLTGSAEFDELFFKKIDEIENKISNGITVSQLSNELKIKTIIKKNYLGELNKDEIENRIYEKRNENNIQLIDENDFYLLYEIDKIDKKLPSLQDKIFIDKVKKILFNKDKFEFNRKIITQINNKKFNNNNYDEISKGINKKIILDSIKDHNKFNKDSVKILYSLPVKSYTLIGDNNDDIYLAQVIKLYQNNISKNSTDYLTFVNETNIKIRDNMYSSYDYFLNDKYKIKINQKTLERVKNYFR
jgi:peptidyl-prolyl cis-trans isomerase D